MQLPFEDVVTAIVANAVKFGGLCESKPPTRTSRTLANTLADIYEQVVGAAPEGNILDLLGVTPGQSFLPATAAAKFMALLAEGLSARHIRELPVWECRRR